MWKTMNLIKDVDFFEKSTNFHTNFCRNFEFRPVRRNVDLVDLEKCCKMIPWSQKSASIQRRTSPPKFLENRGPEWECRGSITQLSAFRTCEVCQKLSQRLLIECLSEGKMRVAASWERARLVEQMSEDAMSPKMREASRGPFDRSPLRSAY